MDRDAMAEINHYCQKNNFTLDYSDVKATGPAHCPEFTVVVKIGDEKYGEGTGKSKKEARAAAAEKTWEMIEEKKRRALQFDGGANLDQGAHVQLLQRHPSEISSTSGESSSSHEMSNMSDSDGTYFESSAASLVEEVKNMAITEKPMPAQKNARCSAQKSPGRLFLLAPAFDKAVNKRDKNAYSVDERFLKDFENIVPIGEGGFGNVFKATARMAGITYAVKRVRVAENVMREIKGLACLNHENIVRYYSSWKGEDYVPCPDASQEHPSKCECIFIQMEFCEKGTLENWVEDNRGKRRYQEMAQDKFLQVVKGVEYIHSKGLIHRDLKPQNIFISNEDKIKIGDFGLVTSESYQRLTENRGTTSYMAPEQFGAAYGKEVDIYALGLIWFEILSALASHHEKCRIWQDVKQGNFPRSFSNKFPSEAPMIKQMLSADPHKRPSASQLLKFVKHAVEDKPWRAYTH
ncbi:PREDICTED: interferon-induced, double-stranded RNA-activated protein kinase [Tinamus guttatus]|uniref:interferon-induced, double-stranded RNA-activated protein kinase n=1 Tax=Tinamus guttatus TaxID=94827 RepID=UPI00052EA511|nr:PREDICTED: interferon-induced, double-stranded RNA-activated protein kinase [Tinamus guttatus]